LDAAFTAAHEKRLATHLNSGFQSALAAYKERASTVSMPAPQADVDTQHAQVASATKEMLSEFAKDLTDTDAFKEILRNLDKMMLQKMLPAHVGNARSPAPVALGFLLPGLAVALRMRVNNGARPFHSPPGRGRQARGRWGPWGSAIVVVGFHAPGSEQSDTWMEAFNRVLQNPEPEVSSNGMKAWSLAVASRAV